MSVFVSATGTGIGKTLLAAALVSQLGPPWRARKPLASGVTPGDPQSDPAILALAQNEAWKNDAPEAVCLHQFEAPLAPDCAAAQAGIALDWTAIVDFCRGPNLVVEGAGGLFSPLTAARINADLAQALRLPVLLMAGTYLGTLSHLLATLEAARARKLTVGGLVLSESAKGDRPEEIAARLRGLTLDPPPILCLPRLRGPEPWRHVPDLRPWLGECGIGG